MTDSSVEVQKSEFRQALTKLLESDSFRRRVEKGGGSLESLTWLRDHADELLDQGVASGGRVRQEARKLRKEDPALTQEQAVAKLFTERPDLIDEAREASKKTAGALQPRSQ
jgi:hypothetical protein